MEDRQGSTWLLFTVTWAVAVLFHIAGNARLAPEWGRAGLGIAAIALLTRPESRVFAAVLAVAVLANVWLEAPLLSNHWLLHGLIAGIVLGALVLARDKPDVVRFAVGPLRLLLLAFYCFAALAKLNSDFFDPAVSCGAFYLEESARSWDLGSLVAGWSSGVRTGVAVVVVGMEMAIPVLLVIRRTRPIGVVVALAFHFVLALDRTHQFFDFSAVLVVLFLLFLPPVGRDRIVMRARELRDRLADRWASGPELLRLVGLAAAGLVVVVASGPGDWPAPPVLRSVGVAVWIAYGLGTVALAVRSVRATEAAVERLVPVSPPPLLLVVPLLAAINGLTPYVELKTSASWNMYSNLAVVDGTTNHLLVPAGVRLGDGHGRLVEVTDADGVDLGFYIGSDWRLPEVMLEDHLADRPGATVTGRVDGEMVRYVGGAGGARPSWQRKLQVFRAVDGDGPVGCQPSFGPAR